MATSIYRHRSNNQEFIDPSGTSTINRKAAARASGNPENRVTSNIDEVIGVLSNAYENKRARQVIEWERQWRQHIF